MAIWRWQKRFMIAGVDGPGGVGQRAIAGMALLLWFALMVHVALKLPIKAIVTGDTESYLVLAPHRPPLYGWFLNAFQWTTGGLDYLPLLQLILMAAGMLVFSIELGRLLRSALVGAAAPLLLLFHQSIYETPGWMMSESVFGTLVLLGLGLQFRHVRRQDVGSLLAAAACFALAAATRTAGAVFLLIPLLFALLDKRRRFAAAAAEAARVVLVAGLVLVLAMAGNWAKNGRFEIGSWAGVSLLGKGLLLVEPSDLPGLPPPVATVAPVAKELRGLIVAQPDFAARLRAQMQAYQDLRFPLFYPLAEKSWPAWAEGDLRERGALALALAKSLIERHPGQYLELWMHDWMSLVLYPMHWPAWGTEELDPGAFPACRLQGNCWVLARLHVPARILVTMLAVSLVGTAGGALLLLFASWRVVRRRAQPETVLFWSIALALQASLLATSAFEAGLERYTNGTHVLGLALLLWFVSVIPLRQRSRAISPPVVSTGNGRPAMSTTDY